jgi:hypothetical protein
MGLDTTHDAFHGAYSAFNRFRQAVASAAGGSFPPHDDKSLDPEMWYTGDGVSQDSHPGLWEFMSHSDCDGDISPEMCAKVADDLEALLPKIEALAWPDAGHIARRGGMVKVTEKFIAGCRSAHAANEPLEFW